MKNKKLNPLPGVTVGRSLQTVTVSPSGFKSWPWSGLAYPCKGSLSRRAVFSFDHGSMDLNGDEIPASIDAAAGALADDCKALCLFLQSFIDPADGCALLRCIHDTSADSPAWNAFHADLMKEERKRGAGCAEWAAMESWGGRVGCPRKARESAAAFLKAHDDGDPCLHEGMPAWGEGDTLQSSAEILHGFNAYSQRFDRAREALETLGLAETFADICCRLDDERREAWESGFWETLCQSAISAAGIETEGGVK
jgi:hypothetical protein